MLNTTVACSQSSTNQPAEEYFVAARHGDRFAPVLGPYATREEADANVDRGRDLAIEADRWAVRYEFGVIRTKGVDVGKHEGRFGR